MECTGTVREINLDYKTGKMIISLNINEDVRDMIDSILGVDKLRIKLSRYRKKRSLDANAYFHVLVGKIADVLESSKQEVKNDLLSRYGQYEIQNGSLIHLIIRDDINVRMMDEIHLQPTTSVRTMDDGNVYRVYRVIRGSHTYNTKEMSQLIKGTVNEAKELGIETATPQELAVMEKKWGVKFEQHNTS